jgi:hypothetical protein
LLRATAGATQKIMMVMVGYLSETMKSSFYVSIGPSKKQDDGRTGAAVKAVAVATKAAQHRAVIFIFASGECCGCGSVVMVMVLFVDSRKNVFRK